MMSQGALTPGLGLAPSDTDSETTSLLSPTYEDEEAAAPHLKHAATLPIRPSSPMTQSIYGTMKAKGRIRLASPSSLGISKIRRARTAIHEADEIWDELEEGRHSNSGSPLSTRRVSFPARLTTSSKISPGSDTSPTMVSNTGLPPDEQTTLLRSSTGRSYRDRKPRQTSVSGTGHARRKSQEAVGGWWKMQRWWNGGTQRNKDQDDTDVGTGSGAAVRDV